MDKASFCAVLDKYKLPWENVYEDLSEMGTVLWHNDSFAIKVVCPIKAQPCLSFVALCPDGDYVYFESELSRFSSTEVEEVVTYAKENCDSLQQSAVLRGEELSISVSGGERTFARTHY